MCCSDKTGHGSTASKKLFLPIYLSVRYLIMKKLFKITSWKISCADIKEEILSLTCVLAAAGE
tara:strand:+ start:176 stop:364 length:189 start_codon:yes stop_codon:yes gene_type:complete